MEIEVENMKKYNKVISPILMLIITFVLMFIILGATFLNTMSISSLKRTFNDVKYYDLVVDNIHNSLVSYMTEEQIDELFANNRIKNNINKLLNSMESVSLKDEENYLKIEFRQDILNIIDNINIEDTHVDEYITKITKAYFANLFPTTEISLIQDIVIKIKELVLFGIAISCICLVLCVIYLFRAGKQNKWLFVAIYNCIILCLVMLILLTNFTNIYYSNKAVTEVLQGVITNMIKDIVIFVIVLIILVSILNYIVYFKKVNKH